VNTLRIPLAKMTGKGVAVHAVVSIEDVRPQDAGELDAGPITVSGDLSEMTQQYLFQGRISGTYRRVCDRCLEAAEQAFDTAVAWVFVPGPAGLPAGESADDADAPEDECDAEFTPFEGDEIDLRARVWEELVLAAPTKFLCKEGCAGLCPECGADLNRAPCACHQTATMKNSGLAGLADLLPDLGPTCSEDTDHASTET